MRLWLTLLAALLASASAAHAQAPQVQRMEVVEYGIYTVDKTNCRRDAQDIERCDRGNIHHAVTTWTVPAQLGVEFGLRYRLIGAPAGARVVVQRAWLLPPPGFRPPAPAKPIGRIDRQDTLTIGQPLLISYGFDDPWELVPGPWTLEFWYAGHKLGTQVFTVARP